MLLTGFLTFTKNFLDTRDPKRFTKSTVFVYETFFSFVNVGQRVIICTKDGALLAAFLSKFVKTKRDKIAPCGTFTKLKKFRKRVSSLFRRFLDTKNAKAFHK